MNDIPYYKKNELSLNSKSIVKQKDYTVPEVKLSENIQKFDKRPRVYTNNPYSFNEVSKKQIEAPIQMSPTATQMITDPLYNEVGKSLGVDTLHEWGMNYDKVQDIVDLAKQRSGIKDSKKLSNWIYQLLNKVPSLGGKRINDVHVFLKMGGISKPKIVTRTVVKKVIKYIKPKETTEQFVNKWIGEQFNGN